MSNKRMAVMLLAFAFIMLPVGLSLSVDNGTDAADLEIDSASVNVSSFNERSDGRLSVTIINTSNTEKPLDVYVTWLNDESGHKLAQTSITVPAKNGSENGRAIADLNFRISSPGTHYVEIHVNPDSDFPTIGVDEDLLTLSKQTVKIDVDSSIWSNTTTYIIIIIVVIIVIVAVYLRMRSTRTRAPKTQGTFTAMEAERKASKSKRSSTDVVRADTPTEGTFTAMEREKKAAKEKQPVEAVVETNNVPEPMPVTETKVQEKTTEKQEYTGRVSRTKPKQQQSAQRKSNPNSRKSSKRK